MKKLRHRLLSLVTGAAAAAIIAAGGTGILPQNFSLPTLTAQAEAADALTYLGDDGESVTVSDFMAVTAADTEWTMGTYAVTDDITLTNRVTVTGTVNLILCDGAELSAPAGIQVGGENALNIFAQSTGDSMGKLTAETTDYNAAAIGGGSNKAGGTITITGGNITAIKGSYAEDVGNGYDYSGSDVCNITLGWTKITDSIKSDSYDGVVKYAKPLALENGSLAAADNIAGQTLTPVGVLADKISALAPSLSQLRFTADFGAKNVTLKYAALIATTNPATGKALSYENCSYLKGKSNPVLKDGSFTLEWTRSNIKEWQIWYVRPYYKYTLNGKTYKAYGDMIAVQLVDGELVCVNPITPVQ